MQSCIDFGTIRQFSEPADIFGTFWKMANYAFSSLGIYHTCMEVLCQDYILECNSVLVVSCNNKILDLSHQTVVKCL